MKYVKLFLLFTFAPLFGILLALTWNYDKIACTDCRPLLVDVSTSHTYSESLLETFGDLKTAEGSLQNSIKAEEELYQKQQQLLRELSQKSQKQQLHSEKAYEEIILSRLGEPIKQFENDNIDILIFQLKNEDITTYPSPVSQKKEGWWEEFIPKRKN